MARDFPGGGAHYFVNASAVFGMASPLTIAAWITPDTAGFRTITARGDNNFLPDWDAAFKLRISGGAATVNGVNALTAAAIAHVAFVLNGAASQTWINGVLDTTGTLGAVPAINNQPMRIGQRGDTNLAMDGRMSDFALWAVALNAREIGALARGVTPTIIRPGSLRCWWPLWGTSGAAGNEVDLWGRQVGVPTSGNPAVARHLRGSLVAL